MFNCENCQSVTQKSHITPVEKKVQYVLSTTNNKAIKIDSQPTTIIHNQMDYSNKTCKELIVLCKDKCIKGYSGKKRDDILKLINEHKMPEKQDTGKFRTNQNRTYK